jgi:hypothetical protein
MGPERIGRIAPVIKVGVGRSFVLETLPWSWIILDGGTEAAKPRGLVDRWRGEPAKGTWLISYIIL